VLLVFSFLLRSPSSIWLAVFLFLEMAMYVIGGYFLQHPPSV
jgi:hypothetical protein